MLAEEYNNPDGVELSAILFGGRRKTTIPLVTEARRLVQRHLHGLHPVLGDHGRCRRAVGVVRRDPMAMLPFIGYDAGDYLNHWVNLSAKANPERLPKIFLVNWFRRTAEGGFAWPGFGDNARVLKWAIERLEGKADAVETPIGFVPTGDSIDLTGLDMTPAQVEDAVRVDPDGVGHRARLDRGMVRQLRRARCPRRSSSELEGLKARLA